MRTNFLPQLQYIPLPLIGAGLQAGGALISGIQGLLQGAKARKLAKQNIRPTYEIPKEIQTNLRLAKARSNQGLSPQAYGNAMNNIWRNRNAAMGAANDRRSGLAAIGSTNQSMNDASLKLDVIDSDKRDDNMQRYMGQNQVMAGYQDKKWDYNNRQKFEENAAAIRALYGASRENGNRAMNGLMMAGQTAFGNGMFNKKQSRPQQDWTNYEDN